MTTHVLQPTSEPLIRTRSVSRPTTPQDMACRPLAGSRGIRNGVLLSLPIWALLILAAYLVF
jgi:hypothetical protein